MEATETSPIDSFGGMLWFIPWCLGIATLLPTALPWLLTPIASDSFPAFFPNHAKPAAKVAGSIALVALAIFFLRDTGEEKNNVRTLINSMIVFLWTFGPLLLVFWVNEKVLTPWRQKSAEERKREEQQKLDAEQILRENERHQRERELQVQSERTESSEQQRRDDARFACQMLYDRHRLNIEERFSSAQLEAYFEKYLSDQHIVSEVERRAEQLRNLLEELISGSEGTILFKNVIEIREHYHQDRIRIEESAMDQDIKETLLADLAREEERSIREFRQR